MRCETCSTALERPGDYCLTCDSANTDAIVISLDDTQATLTFFDGEVQRGQTTIPTTPESAERITEIQERNYLSRIGDEIHRKRPEAIYVTGEQRLIRRLRRYTASNWYRIDGDDPISQYQEMQSTDGLAIVDATPAEKFGGSHTTVIGGRRGQQVLHLIGDHPHVKKIIPGPIEAGGSGSQQGFGAKATRATTRGNIRVLLRDGSSVQEIRIVTTAGSIKNGERVSRQLNAALTEEGYR